MRSLGFGVVDWIGELFVVHGHVAYGIGECLKQEGASWPSGWGVITDISMESSKQA
jgi:hypothetical protein